jgi:hypothetical protein
MKFAILPILGILFSPLPHPIHSLPEHPGNKIKPVAVIQATDLYHPHNDPDDHYDLATLYALADQHLADLKGILIDYPGKPGLGDPDVMGVAQLNVLTGLAVPAVVGTPVRMTRRDESFHPDKEKDMQGISWVLQTLEKSAEPIVINIVGNANDVAIALRSDPDLFRRKCRAIYLNAGSALKQNKDKLEYNVGLNPAAYAAIFDAPCPVYWMPCFTSTVQWTGEYGTYWKFRQSEILPRLPPKLQNFFLFMLDRKSGNNWFAYLNGEPEQALIAKYGAMDRNMWCTAGFLHAAGKKVTPAGDIVDLDDPQPAVCSFLPVSVTCDNDGLTSWKPDPKSKTRFLFHVDDRANYTRAMMLALKQLLVGMAKQ